MTSQERIKRLADDFRLTHLVHFTRIENLKTILKFGLLPRAELERRGIPYIANDSRRLDHQGAGPICFSIGFPNDRMLHKYRMSSSAGLGFCVSEWALDPLWGGACAFFERNASSIVAGRRFEEVDRRTNNPAAFSAMFEGSARSFQAAPLPLDAQAEVLVFEGVPLTGLKKLCFSGRKEKAAAMAAVSFLDKGKLLSRGQVRPEYFSKRTLEAPKANQA